MQLWNDFSEHPIMFARQSSGPFSFSFAEVIFALLLDRVSCGAFNSKAKRVKTHMLANRLGRFRFPSRR